MYFSMLKLFVVFAVFVAAAQVSATCSDEQLRKCLSKFRHLSEAKDSKEKICRVYHDIAKCLVVSRCKLRGYAGHFMAIKEACEGKCELTKVVTCKLEVHSDMIKNNGSYCSYHPKYRKCFDNTDCKGLMDAQDKLMKKYCDSVGTEDSDTCSEEEEETCLSKFRHLSEAKDSKEKICRVYHDIAKCLVVSHCKIRRYAGLFMAIKEACEGKCELTKVVTCKLEVHSDMIKNNGSYCSYHPKYRKCFDNTDCKGLMDAQDRMMEKYCGTEDSDTCSEEQEEICLSKFRYLSQAKDSKEKICRVYHDIAKCLVVSHCKLRGYAGLFMAIKEACEGKCELTKVVTCKLEVHSDMIKNNGSYCSYHPKYRKCFDNTDCKGLMDAQDKLMEKYCDSVGTEDSDTCSEEQEKTCLSKFRYLSQAKDSKKKICRVYFDIAKCLVLSHCKLRRYGGLFKATKEACEGKCELTKVVACKLEVHSDMIKNNGSYCSYHPKYRKCFDNTDCKGLMDAQDKLMEKYCEK